MIDELGWQEGNAGSQGKNAIYSHDTYNSDIPRNDFHNSKIPRQKRKSNLESFTQYPNDNMLEPSDRTKLNNSGGVVIHKNYLHCSYFWSMEFNIQHKCKLL